MVLHDPVVALLLWEEKSTWHPVLFSSERNGDSVTYVPKGHHKTGFPTREAALEHIEQKLCVGIPDLRKALEPPIPYHGEATLPSVRFLP